MFHSRTSALHSSEERDVRQHAGKAPLRPPPEPLEEAATDETDVLVAAGLAIARRAGPLPPRARQPSLTRSLPNTDGNLSREFVIRFNGLPLRLDGGAGGAGGTVLDALRTQNGKKGGAQLSAPSFPTGHARLPLDADAPGVGGERGWMRAALQRPGNNEEVEPTGVE